MVKRSRYFKVMLVALLILGFSAPAKVNASVAEPQVRKMILDVDMNTDTDDLLAIRACEKLDKEGKEDLIGVCMSVTGGENALASLLSYDGYGHVPVGISSEYISDSSPYWEYLESIYKPDNEMVDAVKLYRKLLSESETRISIVTTGYLTNIYELLKSGPDEYSNLSGTELVRQKVRAIHVTGGNLIDHIDNNYAYVDEAKVAADYVFEHWPAGIPAVIYTQDLGGNMYLGYDLDKNDPVYSCIRLAGRNESTAWDIFNVWAFSKMDYNDLSSVHLSLKHCYVDVTEDGRDVITDDESAPWWRIVKLWADNNWYKKQVGMLLK